MSRLSRALVPFLLVVALGGCSVSAPPTTPAPSASSAYGGFDAPLPDDDEVVLTVEGPRRVEYTFAELKRRAAVEFTIVEPFVQRKMTFRGVPLEELFADGGIERDAEVESSAINLYRYTLTAGKWADSEALLAVFRDGAEIPMDQGGPIRIVFPKGVSQFENLDAWNWSLRSLTVVP